MSRTPLTPKQRGRKVALYMTAKVRTTLTQKARAAGVSLPKAAALAITDWNPNPKQPE